MTPEQFRTKLSGGPLAFEWQFSPLPPVESVPYDHVVILWSTDYVGFVIPWGDNLNVLRWCNDLGFPKWGTNSPIGWWTVLRQGSAPRPPEVQTYAEFREMLRKAEDSGEFEEFEISQEALDGMDRAYKEAEEAYEREMEEHRKARGRVRE